jgi:hypothetical protein
MTKNDRPGQREYMRRKRARLRSEDEENYLAMRSHENTKYTNKKRQMVLDAKADGCIDCGRKDLPPPLLELDHVRGERKFTMASCSGKSLKAIAAEIEKCEVRCPTCHALRHYHEPTPSGWRLGVGHSDTYNTADAARARRNAV